MIFNINLGYVVAKLTVKFPAGSSVTIASNGLTLTAQNGPTDTEYTFMVPFPGDWVITIVVDGITTTETVLITAGENQNVAPAVKRYIFNKGDLCTSVSGGWTNTGYNGTINTNYPDGFLRYGTAGDWDGGFRTVNSIVVPSWAKNLKAIAMYNGTAVGGPFGLTTTPNGWPDPCFDLSTLGWGEKGTVSVDVSSLAGQSRYAGIYHYGTHEDPYIQAYYYEVWFESDTSVE